MKTSRTSIGQLGRRPASGAAPAGRVVRPAVRDDQGKRGCVVVGARRRWGLGGPAGGRVGAGPAHRGARAGRRGGHGGRRRPRHGRGVGPLDGGRRAADAVAGRCRAARGERPRAGHGRRLAPRGRRSSVHLRRRRGAGGAALVVRDAAGSAGAGAGSRGASTTGSGGGSDGAAGSASDRLDGRLVRCRRADRGRGGLDERRRDRLTRDRDRRRWIGRHRRHRRRCRGRVRHDRGRRARRRVDRAGRLVRRRHRARDGAADRQRADNPRKPAADGGASDLADESRQLRTPGDGQRIRQVRL